VSHVVLGVNKTELAQVRHMPFSAVFEVFWYIYDTFEAI
jgi:hypothetical protein